MQGVRNKHPELLRFDGSELIVVLVFSVLFAIILTLNVFFAPDKTLVDAAFTFLVVFLGMLIAVFLHEGGHKYVASIEGYSTEIRLNSVGLVISLVVSLYSLGIVPFITPNVFRADSRSDLRISKFYRYDNAKQAALIAGGGLAGTTLAIVLFSTLYQITGTEVFLTIVFGAVLHGVYSLLPFELITVLQLRFFANIKKITPGDGLHIWWAGTPYWIFALSFMILFGMLAMFSNRIAYVICLLLAGTVTWLYSKFLTKP